MSAESDARHTNSSQKRYAHLFTPSRRTDVIAAIQARADRNIARFGLIDGPDARRPPQTAKLDASRRCT